MISLAKDTTATPDFYSDGDGTDPVSVSITLDGTSTPTHVTTSPTTLVYVWADNMNAIDNPTVGTYTDITVGIVGADAGIVWELSPDGTTGWAALLNLSTMDVAALHTTTQIYARATAINDGTVPTANYTTADVQINALENPAA